MAQRIKNTHSNSELANSELANSELAKSELSGPNVSSDPKVSKHIEGQTAGQLLRVAREAKGYSVADVADILRIRLVYLHAIEAGQYQDLPSGPYVSGFLRTYADLVGLSEAEVMEAYENETGYLPRPTHAPPSVKPEESRFTVIGTLTLSLLLLIFIGVGWSEYKDRTTSSTGDDLAENGQLEASQQAPTPTETSLVKPDSENPDSENPDSENPGPENPGPENPGPENLSAEDPNGRGASASQSDTGETATNSESQQDPTATNAQASKTVNAPKEEPSSQTLESQTLSAAAQPDAADTSELPTEAETPEIEAPEAEAVKSETTEAKTAESETAGTSGIEATASDSSSALLSEVSSTSDASPAGPSSIGTVKATLAAAVAPYTEGTIEIVAASADSWVRIAPENGSRTLFQGIVPLGSKIVVSGRGVAQMSVGNAGGLEILRPGSPAEVMGEAGEVLRDYVLTVEGDSE